METQTFLLVESLSSNHTTFLPNVNDGEMQCKSVAKSKTIHEEMTALRIVQ